MAIQVTPYIPRSITVHLAPAGTAAENLTVPFPEYIKNVASSEIYPTWEEQALRANILAQISFALNRVYTEYYRSRGYDFDITASPANDQKFIAGRSTFENVDRLVDELFTSYLRRQGFVEPLSARFCNGTTVTCDGLSQWGSEELARQGYDAMSILRRYYGEDIQLVTGAPIRDLAASYPGSPLRSGSSGEYVVVLQTMLNRIARNYPAIPRITPVDGIFGPRTLQSVLEFQRIFQLSPDGVVGPSTWYKLVSLYVGVTRLSELSSEGQQFTQVQAPGGGVTLREGSRGPTVSALQFFIAVLGEALIRFPTLDVDGIFGPRTRQAVEDAQRYLGLPATGVVDNETWLAIYDAYTAVARTLLAGWDLPLTPEEIREELASGQFPGYELTYQP